MAAFGLLVSCSSPSKELDYEPTKYDSLAIDFAAEKGWETNRLESGLHVYIEKEGSAEKPKASDFINISLKGYLMDGKKFADTEGRPVEARLSDIQELGLKEGIKQFGRGGKGVLIIPPSLAYGENQTGPIPANSMLYFEIEVNDFSSNPPQPAPRKDYSPEIEAYVSEKGWDAKPTGSGLYIVIEDEGAELKPQVSQTVTIFYKGYLLDGTVFDGTAEDPATFPLGGLIPGWQEGIPYFGKGGKGKLIIPPYLAYGDRASGPIPANSILVFDIELVDFEGEVMNQ